MALFGILAEVQLMSFPELVADIRLNKRGEIRDHGPRKLETSWVGDGDIIFDESRVAAEVGGDGSVTFTRNGHVRVIGKFVFDGDFFIETWFWLEGVYGGFSAILAFNTRRIVLYQESDHKWTYANEKRDTVIVNGTFYPISMRPWARNRWVKSIVRRIDARLEHIVDGVTYVLHPNMPAVITADDLWIGSTAHDSTERFYGSVARVRVWTAASATVPTVINKHAVVDDIDDTDHINE